MGKIVEIAENTPLSRVEKTKFIRMAQSYEQNLPDSLYLSQYQLANEYGFTPSDWKEFLKNQDINRHIESELAMLTEIAAREAIQRLQSGKNNAQDVQAAKELLSSSRLLKQKNEKKTQVVITRVPPKEPYQHEQDNE